MVLQNTEELLSEMSLFKGKPYESSTIRRIKRQRFRSYFCRTLRTEFFILV